MTSKKIFESSPGRREAHTLFTVDNEFESFDVQLGRIVNEYQTLAYMEEFRGMKAVLKRWFLSDSANQTALLPEETELAVSVVEQPPLNRTKVALWVWWMDNAECSRVSDSLYIARQGNYTHVFETGLCRRNADSLSATEDILLRADKNLRDLGGSLLDSCVRTWFYVRDIDVNYKGMADGRNHAFKNLGLTPSTRFIASTGIEGSVADPSVCVMCDLYSVIGLDKDAMKQISVPERMNPTHQYGVAFERATTVDYSDRRHLFVSGTASIDCHGEIMWKGDVKKQTLRMIGNVDAILENTGFRRADIGYCLVYLRDMADYMVVRHILENEFPDTPHVMLLAPVCRPGWLVEMECMAVKSI